MNLALNCRSGSTTNCAANNVAKRYPLKASNRRFVSGSELQPKEPTADIRADEGDTKSRPKLSDQGDSRLLVF